MSSDPANRCARNRDSREQPDDSDWKAGRRASRTSATTREVRGGKESSARLSGQLLDKKWRAHRSLSCDRKLDISWDDPFRNMCLDELPWSLLWMLLA